MAAPAPANIGAYEIAGELGRGGMGVVYDARDPIIGRAVALKTILWRDVGDANEQAWLRDRLFREARSAGSLNHPSIVTIYDAGEDSERAFIAMERVEGPTLGGHSCLWPRDGSSDAARHPGAERRGSRFRA